VPVTWNAANANTIGREEYLNGILSTYLESARFRNRDYNITRIRMIASSAIPSVSQIWARNTFGDSNIWRRDIWVWHLGNNIGVRIKILFKCTDFEIFKLKISLKLTLFGVNKFNF
jgi:hypothetical protein